MKEFRNMRYPVSESPFSSDQNRDFISQKRFFRCRFILRILAIFLVLSGSLEAQAGKNKVPSPKKPCYLFDTRVLSDRDLSTHMAAVQRVSREKALFLRESGLVLDHQLLGKEGQEIFDKLESLMVGQTALKKSLAQAVQRAATGTHSGRRVVATYLLLGVTGSGKTLTAEALAEAITGDPRSFVKLAGGEFQEGHEISKILGAPPGYKGHSETPTLVSHEILKNNTSETYQVNVVLVDELEKAHVSFQKMLLEVMESGQLRTGKNETLDFSRTILILTSNLGQSEIQGVLNDQGPKIGFAPKTSVKNSDFQEIQDERVRKAAQKAAERFLSPEFRNRIDQIFVFSELGSEHVQKVLDMNLAFAQRRNFLSRAETKVVFFVNKEAKDLLLRRGYQPEFGGRSLRRAIDRWIVEPMTNLLGSHQISSGDLVEIGVSKDGNDFLFFKKNAESLTDEQLELLYFRIYGETAPAVEINKDLRDSRLEPGDSQERFLFELHLLDHTEDDVTKLNRIANFLNTYERPLSNEQFLQLYHRLPKPVLNLGYPKSSHVLEQLENHGLGQLQKGGFGAEGRILKKLDWEPASLRHLVQLANRVDSVGVANGSQRAHMKQVGEEIQKMLPEFFTGRADMNGNGKLLEALREFFQKFISVRIKSS